MSEFVIGQRWISDTETDLGLGVVTNVELRRVSILFPASEQTRVYAIDQAPLTRVIFFAGDKIESEQGQSYSIESIQQEKGLITYQCVTEDGRPSQITEGELSHSTQLNKPRDRLLTSQIDKQMWYSLRYETLLKRYELSQLDTRGLLGPRVSLIPHQLFIAHQVANRSAPRVLLADEVGLGKTIEAGLIIHQQLISDRAQRILIIVPEALMYQWMIEMLRRFNLKMSLFDQERYQDTLESEHNPFVDEPLLLCSLEFVTHKESVLLQLIEAEWDILVIDEAHHLEWSEDAPSQAYSYIESLSSAIPGLLLLTATPEQLGEESHFARLRLLDPHRYHSLEKFLNEVDSFKTIAHVIDNLLDEDSLNEQSQQALTDLFESNVHYLELVEQFNTQQDNDQARQSLIQILADQHGTGRVLFRNTRNAIKGFPERELHAYPLPAPEIYNALIQSYIEANESDKLNIPLFLTPEIIYQNVFNDDGSHWTDIDTRIDWLANIFKTYRNEKILVICAYATTAMDLAKVLREKYGKQAAVFHENMNIIDRDRAAAYFADMEEGSQVLICSEIGSEGRNFQFAHHLVLFDLPFNPDLLEQRIGRLDRIGQLETIHLHVPYFERSAQAIMYQWYNLGLNTFKQICQVGQAVQQKHLEELKDYLINPEIDSFAIEQFMYMVKADTSEFTQKLQQGRDRFLELNPYQQAEATDIAANIQYWDHERSLEKYLSGVFDMYGVDFDFHAQKSFTLHPTDHMLITHFPDLPDEGATITFDRHHALAHENMYFMTWEHPMVQNLIDLLVSHEHGNTALSIVKLANMKQGSILLEAVFVLECSAPQNLQINRHLPPSVIRIVMDAAGNDLSQQFSFESLQGTPIQLNKQITSQLIRNHQERLMSMFSQAENIAAAHSAEQTQLKINEMKANFDGEIQRLSALQKDNPNIRPDEIDTLCQQKQNLQNCMRKAYARLDSSRLIIAG